jgi:transposase-like protein
MFKGKQYQKEIILLMVRWYLKYPLSYRNLAEIMEERGLTVRHTTIMRWVHQYGPIIDKVIRKHLKRTNDSWRTDETYIKVKGEWCYLYRAVDSTGATIDFYFSTKRDHKAAKKFFEKALNSPHNSNPRVINVDKNPAYSYAFPKLVKEQSLKKETKFRQSKYMNNIIEQDHRHIKRLYKTMSGFKHFKKASSTLAGIEAMNMIRKGQVEDIDTVLLEMKFINELMVEAM